MHVKGSGSDLAAVLPKDLPAVRLEPLRELRQLAVLSDDAMVNVVRGALLDCKSPNPSVETLLHAFLPHRYVDHTHADAILALTDQPDPERHVRAAFGDDVVLLPWIMPGSPLAKAVAAAFEQAPQCRGIVLAKHGLFTFGDDAQGSYERTIELVDRAERYLARAVGGVPAMLGGEPAPLPASERQGFLAHALPVVRGALAVAVDSVLGATWQRVVAAPRTPDDLAAFAQHGSARGLCATNPVTPDHVLRTKPHYLWLDRHQAGDGDLCRRQVHAFAAAYRRYFDTSAARHGFPMLVPTPVVVVIEGVGLVGFGSTPKAAAIAADIAEHTLRVKAFAHALGDYVPLRDDELAEMEYWPLERGKLGAAEPLPLQGQVALVTGAAGAIGVGIVEALLAAGACVHATDVDGDRLAAAMARVAGHGGRLTTGLADITDPAAVAARFADCCRQFGGVDIVVPNAGIAHVGKLETMDLDRFTRVMAVNTHGTLHVLQAAAAVFRAQRTGGAVVVQASKNTFAPGAGFGAYSASKAAALQLTRIAALELAELGVRVNAINADAVFGDAAVPSQLWQEVGPDRMRARGLDEAGLRDFYRDRSLLKVPVLPRHVGEAVVFFASQRTPTTGAVLPVDGGLAEAFPR
jgi:rhamnose utilization protein RhaD (predicted bifunctional aldolase and dehydrogenase)/NAD(P)-dependent dehydrogenase (short-subunit alcohol dehydrogenase family)